MMSKIVISIPWESSNHYITSDIVEQVLNSYCQKRGIIWRTVEQPVQKGSVAIQKIEFDNVPAYGNSAEEQKDHLKTAIHARCFLKVIKTVASL